jgi:hypothetical protein
VLLQRSKNDRLAPSGEANPRAVKLHLNSRDSRLDVTSERRIRQGKEKNVPTYIGLVKLTEQGMRNVKETTKRAKSFREMTEQAGLKVRELLWTMGRYDLVLVIEAPDDKP